MKMMIVGRRRGGLTLRELHTYMADVHGPMVVRYIESQPRLAPQRYAQNPVFDSAWHAHDFVTQVWFDTPAQAGASLETPFYREQLRPDEDRFVDQASVLKIPVTERELRSDASAPTAHRVKLFVLLKRAASVTYSDFMAACDGLSKNLLADDRVAAGRWVQNQAMQRDGQEAPVDVIHELWLADEAEARAMGARWLAAVENHLSSRIEPGSTSLLLAHEHLMFAGHTR